MQICINKATGKIIEMQSEARPGTLRLNAIAAGIKPSDIDEQTVTPEQYKTMIASQNVPTPEKSVIDKIVADPKELAKLKAALNA